MWQGLGHVMDAPRAAVCRCMQRLRAVEHCRCWSQLMALQDANAAESALGEGECGVALCDPGRQAAAIMDMPRCSVVRL